MCFFEQLFGGEAPSSKAFSTGTSSASSTPPALTAYSISISFYAEAGIGATSFSRTTSKPKLFDHTFTLIRALRRKRPYHSPSAPEEQRSGEPPEPERGNQGQHRQHEFEEEFFIFDAGTFGGIRTREMEDSLFLRHKLDRAKDEAEAKKMMKYNPSAEREQERTEEGSSRKEKPEGKQDENRAKTSTPIDEMDVDIEERATASSTTRMSPATSTTQATTRLHEKEDSKARVSLKLRRLSKEVGHGQPVDSDSWNNTMIAPMARPIAMPDLDSKSDRWIAKMPAAARRVSREALQKLFCSPRMLLLSDNALRRVTYDQESGEIEELEDETSYRDEQNRPYRSFIPTVKDLATIEHGSATKRFATGWKRLWNRVLLRELLPQVTLDQGGLAFPFLRSVYRFQVYESDSKNQNS
ncbi:unnamed protein product [Amoebophrya sp. A25]|nr:unnamed protein product [Amoebophrya sp. A25]|eukprot:GSA25T00010257001.1